jgi:hypothetical protein
VRGAIRTLERIGFLERMPAGGRTHQATAEGLHRRPVAFTLAADYRTLFDTANKRAERARSRGSWVERTQTPATPHRASTATPAARPANSPKYKPSEATKVYLGEYRKPPSVPQPLLQNSALEAALDRWKMAFEKAKATG